MSTNVEEIKLYFSINDVLNAVSKLSEEEKDILLGNSKITDVQYMMNNPKVLEEWCCDTVIKLNNTMIIVNALKKMISSLGEQEVSRRMSEAEEMLKDWMEKLKKVTK